MSNKIKKNSFSVEDIINQVAYENYKKEYSLNKIKSVKKHKINIIFIKAMDIIIVHLIQVEQ